MDFIVIIFFFAVLECCTVPNCRDHQFSVVENKRAFEMGKRKSGGTHRVAMKAKFDASKRSSQNASKESDDDEVLNMYDDRQQADGDGSEEEQEEIFNLDLKNDSDDSDKNDSEEEGENAEGSDEVTTSLKHGSVSVVLLTRA